MGENGGSWLNARSDLSRTVGVAALSEGFVALGFEPAEAITLALSSVRVKSLSAGGRAAVGAVVALGSCVTMDVNGWRGRDLGA